MDLVPAAITASATPMGTPAELAFTLLATALGLAELAAPLAA